MFLKPRRQHVVDNNGKLVVKSQNSVDKIIHPKKRKVWPWLVVAGVVVILILGGFFGAKAWRALAQIITKNSSKSAPYLSFLGNVNPNQLQGEGDGRINILLLGMGGANHPGGLLTDTIMVASIDPINKKMALLSIPRDLYVKIPGVGYNKINYANAYGEQYLKDEGGGPALTKKVVSEILDLPIHYYILLDFSGFTKFIDTLDGVDINVDQAVADPYYPAANMEDYDPFYMSTGQHHMDGATALKYARSRETTSDFDRSRRQQQVMVAARDKALSLGVLTNPKKISDIISILGDHLRTDIQLWEMERLFSLAKDIDTSNIVSKVLDNSTDGLLIDDQIDGGYYLIPRLGVENYTAIQKLTHEIFTDPYLQNEKARIQVLNATGQSGKATEVSDMLTSYGYNVVSVEKNSTTEEKTVIYDYSSGAKPYTLKYLTDRFSASVKNQPSSSSAAADIVIVVGKDYLTSSN